MNALSIVFAVALLVEGSPEAAADLTNQAGKLYAQARYSEAEQLYRRALDAAAQAGPAAGRTRAFALGNLGTLLRVTGRYGEAALLLNESLTLLRADRSITPLELGRTLENLATAYRSSGDLARAEAAVIQAKEVYAAHREIQARERVNLRLVAAAIYVEQRRYPEAEALLRATVNAAEGSQAAIAYNSLAALSIARNDNADAERLAHTALERAQASLPEAHPSIAMILNNLAQACRFQGKYLEAETYYRQAIGTWENAVGPSHPDVAKGLMNLAAFYHQRNRDAGAEDLYVRAGAIFERTFGPNAPLTLVVRNELADVLRAQRRFSESERLGKVSVAAMEKVFAADDPRLLRALGNRARLLAETKRPVEAAALLVRLRAR